MEKRDEGTERGKPSKPKREEDKTKQQAQAGGRQNKTASTSGRKTTTIQASTSRRKATTALSTRPRRQALPTAGGINTVWTSSPCDRHLPTETKRHGPI